MNKIAATTIRFSNDKIFVELNNGQVIDTPIDWYPNLRKGTLQQMMKYELWDNSRWIHWEELDEDLSVEGFLSVINIPA